MAFKLILISALLVALASAAPQHGHHHEEEEHHGHPKYHFSYKVNDHKTGDSKSHEESRDGDLTYGTYTVVDPDGYLRIVKYTVDKKSGFQATVERKHLHGHSD